VVWCDRGHNLVREFTNERCGSDRAGGVLEKGDPLTTALPAIETERLIIRPFVMDELEAAHRVLSAAWQEPEFGRAKTLPERERWLRWTVENEAMLAELYQPPYGDRAVVSKSDYRLVGSVGLVPSIGPFGQMPGFPAHSGSRRWFPEVGLYWAVDPAYQGQGIATEAARALIDRVADQFNLGRIIATTEFDNHRSQAVMRKLGMTLLRNPESEPRWLQVVGVLEFGRM
jgi:[ribosomal protein S5]-alanine N-acetyltransferase